MKLFIFGMGYSALHFARTRKNNYARISCTERSTDKRDALRAQGFDAHCFGSERIDDTLAGALFEADRVLVSIPPVPEGDPALAAFAANLRASPNLKSVVYLSTIGVYGDHGGAWIDERTPPRPSNPRSLWRLAAEEGWRALGRDPGLPVHVLRLAGIYGPGQNALVNLRAGTAKRIVKAGQVFNRIHVEDIARTIEAAFAYEGAGDVWNVADDEPAPPQDVVTYAARLLGVAPPPEIDFETAQLSPMARSFYAECKRVTNAAIKEKLSVQLAYPTYREAFADMLKD
jgi:nucleoside-diphosphate-sugar epimerase